MATTVTIGDLEVTAVVDHTPPPRDVGMIFADVPAEAWGPHRDYALDANGMWQTQYCSFVIRPASGGGPIVLVDTGMGPGPHEPGNAPGRLLEELAALGVAPGQVDFVVTTHPHGDHVGWNVTHTDGGAPRATFSAATYVLARADWDHWTQPEIMANVPAIGRSVQPLEGLGVLRLVDGKESIVAGVTTLPAHGHTPGHQCVLIESGGQTGVIVGDLFHNSAQVTEQEWCPTFDWNQDLSRASRREVIARAASEGWTVMACHLEIGRNIGRIVESGGRHTWTPLP